MKGENVMSETVITEQNFEKEVLGSDIPVLVDFFATWCGPCHMLAPIIEEIAKENEGKLKVGKVNVDEQPALAAAFGIESIPTLIVFKNGKVTNKALGYMSKESVLSLL